MTRVFFDQHHSPSYPVGDNMAAALEYTREAAWKLQPIIAANPRKHMNIICRGSSGAICAALLASQLTGILNVFVIHVKKPGESSHSFTVPPFNWVEGINVIIDDFISSGETIRCIYRALQEDNENFPVDVLIVAHGYHGHLGFEPEYLITNR